MAQPGHTWHKLSSKTEDIFPVGNTEVPDFSAETPTQPYYAASVEIDSVEWFYVLTEETWTYPTLTDEEVSAQGIDPNRTISGG